MTTKSAAALCIITILGLHSAGAQAIDFGMSGGLVQSPAGTSLPINTGAFQLYVTNGVFTPNTASTLSDITSNMLLVIDSFTQTDGAGTFYLGGVFPATNGGNIPTGTSLYLLASTSATFSFSSPWALFNNINWTSPNPSDFFAQTFIELSDAGTTIVSAGNGGPGIGAFFGTSGTSVNPADGTNVVLVPEPSTYALLVLGGLALAGHVIRRRRRA